METLVFMDSEDKEAWLEVTEFHNAAVAATRKAKAAKLQPDVNLAKTLQKMTQKFWHDIIEKYGVLRNKQLTIDQINGTINCFTSNTELRKK